MYLSWDSAQNLTARESLLVRKEFVFFVLEAHGYNPEKAIFVTFTGLGWL
jgi:hypothetical protein